MSYINNAHYLVKVNSYAQNIKSLLLIFFRGTLYRGMIDCLQQSVKNEGILSLYKGFLPLWMRLGPWALINWIAFENIMLAIGGHTF